MNRSAVKAFNVFYATSGYFCSMGRKANCTLCFSRDTFEVSAHPDSGRVIFSWRGEAQAARQRHQIGQGCAEAGHKKPASPGSWVEN
jgi:hypothetical protein